MKMTTELIVVLVCPLVSQGLEVVRELKEDWTNWKCKELTLLGGFLVVPTAIWALFCLGGIQLGIEVACGVQGALQGLWLGFVAFLGNQTGYAVATSRTATAKRRMAPVDSR
jgi:hypothetical protein